jgi:hypothetical protein
MTHSIAEEIKNIGERVSVLESKGELLNSRNYIPPVLDVVGIQKALDKPKPRRHKWLFCISEPDVIETDTAIDAIFFCIKNIDQRLAVLEKHHLR